MGSYIENTRTKIWFFTECLKTESRSAPHIRGATKVDLAYKIRELIWNTYYGNYLPYTGRRWGLHPANPTPEQALQQRIQESTNPPQQDGNLDKQLGTTDADNEAPALPEHASIQKPG